MKTYLRIQLAVICTLVICCLLVVTACKKSDELATHEAPPKEAQFVEGRFFTQYPATNPNVKTVQQYLFRLDAKNGFADQFVQQAGFPHWDKALVYRQVAKISTASEGGQEEATVAYIPFVKQGQEFVNSTVVVRMSRTDTAYRVLANWQYVNYGFDFTSTTQWDARDIFNIFSTLDYAVFGYSNHRVKDGRIFGHTSDTRLLVTDQGGDTPQTEEFTLLCRTKTVCITASASTDGYQTDTECTSSTECFLVWSGGGAGGGNSPGGGSGGGSAGGGGSGSGGLLPPDPCPSTNSFRVDSTGSNPCDTTGWAPVEVVLEDDPEYTCPDNFVFVPVTNNNLWQEALLTGIYCNIVYIPTSGGSRALRVEIPQLYFGMAYYNVDGELVFSQNIATTTAADAVNEAELDMRKKFKRNPNMSAFELQQFWVERTNFYMNLYTGGMNRGKATRQGSLNPSNVIIPMPYLACR